MSTFLFLFLALLSTTVLAAPPAGLKNLFREKTKIDNPFQLRDPFKAPLTKGEAAKKGRGFRVTGKGQYSNIQEAALDKIVPASLKLVGVLIGKERRAMVTNGTDKKITILKEGMKIGPEQAEVKAILPGGIVLVEKIVNVYGEEEFLETVIPISR